MSFIFKASTPMELQDYTQEECDLIDLIIHELNDALKNKTRSDPTWLWIEIDVNQNVTDKIAKTICFIFSQAGWLMVTHEIEKENTVKFHMRNPMLFTKNS